MRHDKWQGIIILTAMGMVLSVLLFVIVLVNRAVEQAERNSSKNRVQLCILSIEPSRRTPPDILKCYEDEERESGIKLHRYGGGIK